MGRSGFDRRKRQTPIAKERRESKERRKQCPECGSPLLVDKRKTKSFVQTTFVCTSSACLFTGTNRTVPVGKIAVKECYFAEVFRKGQTFAVELPLELCHFAKLEHKQVVNIKIVSENRFIIEKG